MTVWYLAALAGIAPSPAAGAVANAKAGRQFDCCGRPANRASPFFPLPPRNHDPGEEDRVSAKRDRLSEKDLA